MEFIFMLTQADRTVANCLEVLDEIAPLGLSAVGFKDVGVAPAIVRQLNERIRALGAKSYLEVVATSAEAMLHSARMAVEIGVDHLLGGTMVAETLDILRGTAIGYYPFPGVPVGHPTRLGGDAALIEAQTRAFIAQGCAGVDLLAYRATHAKPPALVRAARRGCGTAGRLICAGDVDSKARIKALRAAGADGFTVGSAAFAGRFAPARGLAAQLKEILSCV
ncbi:hypothetical protein [Acidocella sp.]|uniref:hypothetical protein n=1 Tax=Acidocella sp. TaxID=50710 RepID=UPI00261094EC|nr:hypothetical protein [Acidocella sp.]